jgi:DNA-binding transcriptional LysR family regulator
MQLELRHLRTICLIATTGSLTRAAAVLGVSQPALSAQLKRIESLLGGRVFDRSRRGVTATSYGRFVLTRARSALKTADELTSGTEPGVARFGCVAEPSLIGLLERLFALLPDAEMTIRTEASPRLLLDLLTVGHLDAAALVDHRDLPVRAPVTSRVVAVEPVYVALPSRHPLARRDELDLADLAGETWILPGDLAECVLAACDDAGFAPHVVPGEAAQDLTGRAVVPWRATDPPPPGGTVRPLAGTPIAVRHLIAWRHDGAFAGVAGELTRLAAETLGRDH